MENFPRIRICKFQNFSFILNKFFFFFINFSLFYLDGIFKRIDRRVRSLRAKSANVIQLKLDGKKKNEKTSLHFQWVLNIVVHMRNNRSLGIICFLFRIETIHIHTHTSQWGVAGIIHKNFPDIMHSALCPSKTLCT